MPILRPLQGRSMNFVLLKIAGNRSKIAGVPHGTPAILGLRWQVSEFSFAPIVGGIRSFGESQSVQINKCIRDKIFAFGEDSHALRLVSELPDLWAANANLRLLRSTNQDLFREDSELKRAVKCSSYPWFHLSARSGKRKRLRSSNQ